DRSGPVTALARNAVMSEGRIGVGVLSSLLRLRLAGMAEQTGWFDRPVPSRDAIGLVTRRGVPSLIACVPRNRRFKKIRPVAIEEAAAGRVRPDVIFQAIVRARAALRHLYQAGRVDLVSHARRGLLEIAPW